MDEPDAMFGISHAAYGKDGVRVLSAGRVAGVELVRDVSVGVRVDGDFAASYLAGDNAAILPSDTLRRHALAECAGDPQRPLEDLAAGIAARILAANAALRLVVVSAQARDWEPTGDHSFVLAPWPSIAEARLTRSGPARLRGGVRGLELLSTTGSGFTGFMRDALTVQADAVDRPLCGRLDAEWTYVGERTPPAGLAHELAGRLIAAFTDRPSNAIQELLTAVGREVLRAADELATIALRFDSVPVAPIPAELGQASGGGGSYELGVGSVGVTEVTLTR